MRHFVYTKPGCEQEALKRLSLEQRRGSAVLLAHSSCGVLRIVQGDDIVHTGWFANGYPFDIAPYEKYDSAVHVSIRYKKPIE